MAKKEKIQTLIFEIKLFNNKFLVRKWIKNTEFTIDKRLRQPIMRLEKTFRVRQKNPDWFNKKTFKIKVIDNGVKAIVGKTKTR